MHLPPKEAAKAVVQVAKQEGRNYMALRKVVREERTPIKTGGLTVAEMSGIVGGALGQAEAPKEIVVAEIKEEAINLLRSNEDLPVEGAAKLAVKGFRERIKGAELPVAGGGLSLLALLAGGAALYYYAKEGGA
jgi:hypothetical protein